MTPHRYSLLVFPVGIPYSLAFSINQELLRSGPLSRKDFALPLQAFHLLLVLAKTCTNIDRGLRSLLKNNRPHKYINRVPIGYQ